MMTETKDLGGGSGAGRSFLWSEGEGSDGNLSEDISEDDDKDNDNDVPCIFDSERRLWWFKVAFNVIFPIIWIALGGWYAEMTSVYYKDDDTEWSDAGAENIMTWIEMSSTSPSRPSHVRLWTDDQ